MQKQQKNLLTTILAVLIIFGGISIYLASVDPFTITEASFETNEGASLEPDAQRLSFQLDALQNRHFIYQLGERPIVEPDAIPFNGTHVLKYGSFVDDVFSSEKVTEDLVFPYHYDFRVDSLGQVHLAYIANNYTLYYTVRDPNTGIWNTTALSTPSVMWSLMPGITLGTNEQPRIVYSVRFKENADIFFDQEGFDVINLSSLFYAVLNGSTWLYYDVGDNHATSQLAQKDINRQRIYNPAIKIVNGTSYIAFSNKVSLAVESRLQYIKIPEIPEDITFLPLIHKRAQIGSQQSTYRRPSIHLVGDGILIAFGAWSFGAGSIIFLPNSSVLQDPNPAYASSQWLKESILPFTKLNKQLDSVVGIVDLNGTIFITWSLYDLFNAQTLQFTHDVFLTSFTPTTNSIGTIHTERVTDTLQVHHYSPSISLTEDNIIEIHYIVEDEDGLFTLKTSVFSGIAKAFDNEGFALIASIGFLALFVGGVIALIQLLPEPEEEVLILPHMINLKDEISKD